MPVKKTTPEDVKAFIKASQKARKIKPSKRDIEKINELMKELETEERKKKRQAMQSKSI